jgi:hypothetical protein
MDTTHNDVVGSSATKPKTSWLKKTGYVFLAIFALLYIWHGIWKSSGSGEWELNRDEGGIKVWTLKQPGSALVKSKSVRQMKTTLSALIKYLEDTKTCEVVGCYDAYVIEQLDVPKNQFAVFTSWKMDMPAPLQKRDAQILLRHVQDPKTLEINLEVIATPNKIELENDYIRLKHMHNKWRFTPMPNGEIEVALSQDMDFGGDIPQWLTSLILTDQSYTMMNEIQEHLNLEQFRMARIDYIIDPAYL